jgi:hypothetical protein
MSRLGHRLDVLEGPKPPMEMIGPEALSDRPLWHANRGLGDQFNDGLVFLGFIADGGAGHAVDAYLNARASVDSTSHSRHDAPPMCAGTVMSIGPSYGVFQKVVKDSRVSPMA